MLLSPNSSWRQLLSFTSACVSPGACRANLPHPRMDSQGWETDTEGPSPTISLNLRLTQKPLPVLPCSRIFVVISCHTRFPDSAQHSASHDILWFCICYSSQGSPSHTQTGIPFTLVSNITKTNEKLIFYKCLRCSHCQSKKSYY